VIYKASPLRQVSIAALLLSSGVILGTVAPRARGAEAPAQVQTPPGARARPAAPLRAAAADLDMLSAVAPPDAGSFRPAPDGDPPAFGGTYAVLRGARTDASVDTDSMVEPEVEHAPSFPTVPRGVAETAVPPDTASRAHEPPPSAAPASFRPSPAQGIPRGVAADYPLLAVFEGAGRLLYYDLGVRPGVVPAAIEGAWAPLGDCGRALQADFSAPTVQAGELRAVGRGAPGEPGSAVVVAARQGCEVASRRFTGARPAGEGDRAELGGLAPEGFAAADLVQVARSPGLVLAVFRSGVGSAAVIATTSPGGPASVWTGRILPTDGDMTAIGVFRRGGAAHAWLLVRKGARPTAILSATSPDGRAWSSAGPATLANR